MADSSHDHQGTVERFRCVACRSSLPVGMLDCEGCGYRHVDAEELWAIAVISPAIFQLFAVLVLWALSAFAPVADTVVGPRGVVAALGGLWGLALLQFGKDHLDYRRAIADVDDDRRRAALWGRRPGQEDRTGRIERLRVTARLGAAAALAGQVGLAVEPGPGYAEALGIGGLAGVAVLAYGGVETYRLRAVLRPRMHVERWFGRRRRDWRRTVAALRRVAARARRGVALLVVGTAPYVAEAVRGSRSVIRDVREVLRTAEAERRRVTGAVADRFSRERWPREIPTVRVRWRTAVASMEQHWPAWGVVAVVELWTVLFVTGAGTSFLAETMLTTWLGYTYFLFEDDAVVQEHYDWEPWWWGYSVAGLLPILNIGIGTVYVIRREMVRRGVAGEE